MANFPALTQNLSLDIGAKIPNLTGLYVSYYWPYMYCHNSCKTTPRSYFWNIQVARAGLSSFKNGRVVEVERPPLLQNDVSGSIL